jgi:hypothetical protein
MSGLPAAMAGQAAAQLVAVSPLDTFLQMFNNNPYFIGIMMLILNLGGRFISLEVTKKQEQFLQHPWVRRVLIFTVLFIATRNLWVAFWTTLTVVLFLGYLFNENSSLCLFGQGGTAGSTCALASPGEEMTPEEKEILQRLSAKAQRYQAAAESKSRKGKSPQQLALEKNVKISANNESAEITDEEDVPLSDVYAANMVLLKSS